MVSRNRPFLYAPKYIQYRYWQKAYVGRLSLGNICQKYLLTIYNHYTHGATTTYTNAFMHGKKLYDCKYKFKENYFPLYFFYAVWWIIKRRIKHIMQSSKLPFIPGKWFCSSLKLL